MPKIVKCVSRKVNGMTEVAVPQLFLDPFADGEERTIPDEIADVLLNSPCFEEVKPAKPAAPAAKSDAPAQPAPASEVK